MGHLYTKTHMMKKAEKFINITTMRQLR